MFKKVTIDDASDILAFCLELKKQDAKMSFTSFDSMDKVNSYINDEHNFLYLSVHDGMINAMFTAIRGGGNKSHSCYVACAVKKEFRQQNLATALTNYGLEDVKTVGVLIARTKIYSWNDASIATIKKCGFVESGRMVMHQYEESIGAYIDDLIFHKVL
jgi:RimJ/RimL family protein N-acetyltransferase